MDNQKKYIVVLGDGMADYPLENHEGKTPLELAHIPTMDFLAQHGEVGLVQTVPEGMAPGSDVANLSVMGYDPKACYTGRSPLEAVSMGISLGENDVTYRCNLVTLEGEGDLEDMVIIDHSSGEITTEEAHALLASLNEKMIWHGAELYPGVSYRHCLVLREDETGAEHVPPHDITGKKIKDYLPKGRHADQFIQWMKESMAILKDHPVNLARQEKGLNPANCCWFWGGGTRPRLDAFESVYQKTGGVVSAVDLLKGIGLSAEMLAPEVAGATGTLNTNYEGKLNAALDILESEDFVYIHLEGPDECGHQGNVADKVEAIERIDRHILAPLMTALEEKDVSYHLLLVPDHATPIAVRTHTMDPVPYVLYKSDEEMFPHADSYSEKTAKETDQFVAQGHTLMQRLLD